MKRRKKVRLDLSESWPKLLELRAMLDGLSTKTHTVKIPVKRQRCVCCRLRAAWEAFQK